MLKSIASVFFVASIGLAGAQSNAVAPSRLAHLRRGINLSEWFAQVWDPKGYTKEHFQTWTTSDDIVLIKAAGFDHVRLSVNPQPIARSLPLVWSRGEAGRRDPSRRSLPYDYCCRREVGRR